MRIQAIIKRILLQRKGDKRSLALLFIAPLMILSLMYLLLQVPKTAHYRVGVVTNNAPLSLSLQDKIREKDQLDLIKVAGRSRKIVNAHDLAAVVEIGKDSIDVTYANRDTGKTQVLTTLLGQILQTLQQEKKVSPPTAVQQALPSQLPLHQHYLYGSSQLNPFDQLAPILVSFFVFFFVFLISGISLVNERTSGTLERMLITPVKRSEIVTGYTLAYGGLAVVQTLLVLGWTRYVLRMEVIGAFGWVVLINLLIAMIALLIGLLLSALAKSEFQFIQFVPLAIVPQFLFSGIINVDTMSQPLQVLAHFMPLYYGVDALEKVIKQGMGWAQIRMDLAILLFIILLLYGLNVLALKALRKT